MAFIGEDFMFESRFKVRLLKDCTYRRRRLSRFNRAFIGLLAVSFMLLLSWERSYFLFYSKFLNLEFKFTRCMVSVGSELKLDNAELEL